MTGAQTDTFAAEHSREIDARATSIPPVSDGAGRAGNGADEPVLVRRNGVGAARSLIVITTAARVSALRAMVWEYLRFAAARPDFDFLVALDGNDASTREFCSRHAIPLLYSESREGVGLSKNRVLTAYPDYDHYFFVEDDVALLDDRIFDLHLEAAGATGAQHLSLGPRQRFSGEGSCIERPPYRLRYFRHGTAQFNYFSRQGIERVGGFHTEFAKYRRFGHTEHSNRFVNAGLAEEPFCVLEGCFEGYIHTYDPRSVTRVAVESTKSRIFVGEQDLIDQRLDYFPIATQSEFFPPTSLDLSGLRIPFARHVYKAAFVSFQAVLDGFRQVKSAGRRMTARGAS